MTSAPFIRTGGMRHRAALQSKSETPDGSGGVAVVFVTDRSIWCHIRPKSGNQRLEAQRRESSITHEIFARFNADITTEKRILHQGIAYNIEAVLNPETLKEFVQIEASSGVAT